MRDVRKYAILAVAALYCACGHTVVEAPPQSRQGNIFLGMESPCIFIAAVPPESLSSVIPGDFHSDRVGKARSLENLQCDFDTYSWDTFVAMNWPARDGEADRSRTIGDTSGDHMTVWESWKPVHEVFLSDGRKPDPWGAPPRVPDYYRQHLQTGQLRQVGAPVDLLQAVKTRDVKFLTKIAKGHEWFQTEQPFNTGPLIDQNGQYARFELLMNEPMFDYVVDNELYNVQGQAAFNKPIVFPCGQFRKNADGMTVKDADGRPVTETVGAIVVKAAWKLLDPNEVAGGRFHTRKTVVCTPRDADLLAKDPIRPPGQASNPDLTPVCETVMMGLVGLHIVHKSEDVPQWNWSTFEHVDNVPTAGKENEKSSYSFYSPDHPELPINLSPPRPWDPRTTVTDPAKRSQIVRTIPISGATRQLNELYQARLRAINPKSVWQYYELVSTQWPTRPALAKRNEKDYCNAQALRPADLLGGPAPVFLANATLESYIQGTVPNTSSSCMECHANASSVTGKFGDFTYILERARPRVGN